MSFSHLDPDLLILHVAVATITACTIFNRGECGACALRDGIVVYEEFVTLILRQEKEKKALGAGLMNVRQIPYREAPRFAAILRAIFAGKH